MTTTTTTTTTTTPPLRYVVVVVLKHAIFYIFVQKPTLCCGNGVVMTATSDYVPTICRSVGIKLQAVSEVTESTGYKSLYDELKEEIEATRRDWATRFVFPVYDMNVKALQKRFQLSFCRLLSSAAKGFIAQVGIEGYDATVAVMDLLSMHGETVVAPLNVTTHEFLVVLKEAMGATIIPSPTVEHSLSEVLHKINGTSSSEDREQEDGSTITMNTAHATPAAIGNIYIDEQLNEAESAVAQAASQLELMRALADQARVVADEATRARAKAHEILAVAKRACGVAIDSVDVATTDEAQCVAELNAADKDKIANAKSQLALGVQALLESATSTHTNAVHALNSLCKRATNGNGEESYTMMTTARSTSSLSSTNTPTATVTTTLVTPRSTLTTPVLINPYVSAASALHRETTAAIRDIVTTATSTDAPSETPGVTTPVINGRETVINALVKLLKDGIIKPLKAFHAHTAASEQNRRITKATIEPQLEQAAARIAAVVEAERPINHSTIKRLIHVDVDNSTDELRRRIQSLEAKLGETKNILKRTAATSEDAAMLQRKKAKNAEGDGKKSNKTPGTAVAHSNAIPNKNKTWQRTTTTPTWQRTTTTPTQTKKPWGNNTGNDKNPGNNPNGNGKKPWGNPAGNGNGKKPWSTHDGNGNGKKPWSTPAGNGKGKNHRSTPAGNGGASTKGKPWKTTGHKSGGRK
jgi:hypothetical protein